MPFGTRQSPAATTSGGLTPTAAKTANYTASAGDLVICDANTTGSFTVSLPASPSNGDMVGVHLSVGSVPETVTISGNGNTIETQGDNKLYITGDYLELIWDNGRSEWLFTVHDVIAHSCRLTMSTNEELATATGEYLDWDTEGYDNAGLHEGVTNPSRITIRRSGRYQCFGLVRFSTNSTGLRSAYLDDTRTNAIDSFEATGSLSGGSQQVNLPVRGIVDLTAGDYVELYARQDSGGNLDVESSRTHLGVQEIL